MLAPRGRDAARAAGRRRPAGGGAAGAGRARWRSAIASSSPAACRTHEVQRYYDLIDVLVYPRHRMRLTELVTPLKPLEAMAQGRMLVASDVGGHRELIRDGETGFPVPGGRCAARSPTRSSACSRSATTGRACARRARRFVENERTWARSVARYAARLSAALHARRRRPARGHGTGSAEPCAASTAFSSSTARRPTRRAVARWGGVTVHRGPDDEGTHVDGPCAIGMRRLSIIDLAGGHQPLSQRGRHAVARRATARSTTSASCAASSSARAIASRPGRTAKSLVAPLRASTATTFVERARTACSRFALWDARRQRLLIGRDRLGIKPLYYLRRRQAARVRLARRRRCSRCPGVAPALDRGRAARVPRRSATCRRRSRCSAASRKLPPATLLIGRERARRASDATGALPADVDRDAERRASGSSACARGSRSSVAMQMVSDVPIGAFLSGGIDSSAVVAFMARHSDAAGARPMRSASTAAAADGYYNELPYARRVARALRHRSPRDRRAAGRRRAAAEAALAHGRADRRHGVHHDLPRLGVRAPRRDRDPVRRRRRRAVRRLSALPRRATTRRCFDRRARAALRRAAVALARRLPSDRHSPLLNAVAAREAAFSRRADAAVRGALPRVRAGVRDRRGAAAAARSTAGSDFDALGAAFAAATGGDDALNRMLAVDARDAAARRSAAAHRQDEHGDLARMPRAAARSRAGRARGAHARAASRFAAGG